MAKKRGVLKQLAKDLEAPKEVRRFGSGWFAGFFALVMAIAGLGMVIALRFPDWFATPELEMVKQWTGFRGVIHLMLLGSYALALLSLLLRPRKILGFSALVIGISAAILGGANVQPDETQSWGIFFGLDFFIVNMIATGLMFAPLERIVPHRRAQRLFRIEWREDLFYYLVSSMMVQVFSFLSLAPSKTLVANTNSWDSFREAVASTPWVLQFVIVIFLSDMAQYWYHRTFHRYPFLWGFHAVHHSAKSMDWLAGARMHVVDLVLLRGVTALPMMTLGFSPSVLQAYIGFVYIYSSLLHANVKGDFNWLGHWIATPRFHHWHHGLEKEAFDVNFAIHFPWIDKMFGTFYYPPSKWPENYGVPEEVPRGYVKQFAYPWTRKKSSSATSD